MTQTPGLGRLRWQCRRGSLELDLALSQFLDQGYGDLSAPQRAAFERLLQESDETLQAWIFGHQEVPDMELKDIVRKI
jgi:antitoxin CptB